GRAAAAIVDAVGPEGVEGDAPVGLTDVGLGLASVGLGLAVAGGRIAIAITIAGGRIAVTITVAGGRIAVAITVAGGWIAVAITVAGRIGIDDARIGSEVTDVALVAVLGRGAAAWRPVVGAA